MPKRWTDAQRKYLHITLLKRDGPYCRLCGEIPDIGKKLEIDHIIPIEDGGDDEESNLRLICKSQNVSRENRLRRLRKLLGRRLTPTEINQVDHDADPAADAEQSADPAAENTGPPKLDYAYGGAQQNPSALRECVCVSGLRSSLCPVHADIKGLLGYEDGSAELKSNNYFERRWREWVVSKVGHQGYIVKEDAIYGATEKLGFNPETAKRYWGKITSSEGMLAVNDRRFRFTVWELKPQIALAMKEEAVRSESRAQRKIIPLQAEQRGNRKPK